MMKGEPPQVTKGEHDFQKRLFLFNHVVKLAKQKAQEKKLPPGDKIALQESITNAREEGLPRLRENLKVFFSEEDLIQFMSSANKEAIKEEPPIYEEGKNGSKILDHRKAAEFLIGKFHFKTIGIEKKEIYYFDDDIYRGGGKNVIGSEMQKITGGKLKNNDVSEIEGHVMRLTYINRDDIYNVPLNLICVDNGILNIETKELQKHESSIVFTQKLNINFRSGVECKRILAFLSEILRPEDIPIIQEFLGYCLYRKYLIKRALIFVGEPNTSKTTLIKVIVKFLGEANTSGVSLHKLIRDRFAAASLQNKLINFYDDLSFQDIKETGGFKIAVGGGYLSAEKKFGENFEFMNYAKLLFATNKISAVDNFDDDAYYLRWIIIFFENVFDDSNPKTNKNIIEELTTEQELSGLLNWALDGLTRLLKNQKFSYDKTAEEIKQIMERNSNSLSAFVQDCLIEKTGAWISKEELFVFYSNYCRMQSLGRVTKEKFGRQITQKALFIVDSRKDTEKKKSVHGWLNVGINTTNTAFFPIISNKQNNNNTLFSLRDISKKLPVLPIFNNKEKLTFDDKCLVWQPCLYPNGDAPCGDSPCNELDGLYYCKKHFEVAQNES